MQSHAHSPTSRGFTLIELLTVIAIIAILMALLFPAYEAIKDQGRKASASVAVQGIISAVKNYYTEYGKFPDITDPNSTSTTSSTNDLIVGDKAAGVAGNPNSLLFCTLRAIDDSVNASNAQNPRKIVYFEGKRVGNPLLPKDGFQDDPNQGDATTKMCFFDPWGSQYNVVLDTSGDNKIDVGSQYTDFATPNEPRVQVGAFSLGKDKKLGDNGNNMYKNGTVKSDDVVSWTN
jgi:prepilin-type N-terminal cleavage/methylation domain-containing protein